jgi:GxxExxY protein
MLHQETTSIILQYFYKGYNSLGYGSLEKIYENALFYELVKQGLSFGKQAPITVTYGDLTVGDYFVGIILEEIIIIELKAAKGMAVEHEFQLINYLKATNIELGLLLNFGRKLKFKREMFSNDQMVNQNLF